MAVLLFVLFWALIAVGLVVVGIRSGRGGAPPKVNASRGGRAYWYVAFAVVLVAFGAGLPIASSLGRDNDSRSRSDRGHQQPHRRPGARPRAVPSSTAACATRWRRPTRSPRSGRTSTPCGPTKGLVLDAIKNGRARGNGAMARNLVVGQDAEDVADFVSVAVGQKGK